MNILFVVPYVPNLIRVRPYNLIRGLTKHGHHVTLVTLWQDEQEREDLRALGKDCDQLFAFPLRKIRSLMNCAGAVVSHLPLQAAYCWSPAAAAKLSALIRGSDSQRAYDVVHVEHLRGARYGLLLRQQMLLSPKAGGQVPIVWDSVDCISHLFRMAVLHNNRGFRQLPARLDLPKTERYEGWLLDQFDRILVTSSVDRDELTALYHGGKKPEICVLQNGVDDHYFAPEIDVDKDDATLIVSGKMSYHANVTMVLFLVREIMPLVWASRPDVKLRIVGKDPPREVMELHNPPRIEVTGFVADIRPYLQHAALSVSPLVYGTGIQNKVLEAMACETPVVSTSLAVSALAVDAGVNIMVADGAEPFAQAVLTLLNNAQQRSRIGRAGREYVLEHHSWDVIMAQLEHIYRDATTACQAAIAGDS